MGNRVLPIIKDRITDTGKKIYLILRKKNKSAVIGKFSWDFFHHPLLLWRILGKSPGLH